MGAAKWPQTYAGTARLFGGVSIAAEVQQPHLAEHLTDEAAFIQDCSED